jgi:S-(hydroxymethyl)glutathione dehydrogenase/alcohol dehydrogenase
METRAAVLWGKDQQWQIETVRIDPPRAGEVIVEWKVAGLCHSDEHLVTGDMVPPPEALSMMASCWRWARGSAP